MGEWRNGRRDRLKICCPFGREGSTPSSPTKSLSERSELSEPGLSHKSDCHHKGIPFMSEKPTVKKLDNGLKVVYVPFKGIDSVNFRLVGRAGGMWENPQSFGVAHYIEHLAFDGTKKYPDPDVFRGLVEDNGGFINAYTSYFEVNYQAKILKQEMEKAFDFLSQQAIHPLFRDEDIEKQRTIIIQEHKMYLDNPVEKFDQNSQKHVYAKGSRFQEPLIGTFEALEKMNKESIKEYFDRNYIGDNFVLSICGDGVEKECFELATKYFSEMPQGNKNEYTKGHYVDEDKTYTENNNEIKQATVSVMYPTPVLYTPNFYPAKYLNTVFGGGFMSRLFKEIRQNKGLAYYVQSMYQANASFGTLDAIAQIEPENVEKVLKLIKTEISKISKTGITKQEFDRTRKSIISTFAFDNENPGKKADTEGKLVLNGQENDTYETILEKYMEVTIEDVNKIAKEIFSHHPKIRVLSNNITNKQVLNAWNS